MSIEQRNTTYLQPMRYRLKKLTQEQTLNQISLLTGGFYTMSAESAFWIQDDVRSREFTSFGRLPLIEGSELLHKITGKDWYFLKVTSRKHNMDYIWYDNEKNEFQFWGEYKCCIRAMNAIRYRIHKVVNAGAAASSTAASSEAASSDKDITDELLPVQKKICDF